MNWLRELVNYVKYCPISRERSDKLGMQHYLIINTGVESSPSKLELCCFTTLYRLQNPIAKQMQSISSVFQLLNRIALKEPYVETIYARKVVKRC